MNKIKKKELIKAVSSRTGCSIKKSTEIIQSLLDVISNSLKEGEDVSLCNFGAFKIGTKNERTYYDISIREIAVLPKQTIIKFIPFKQFKKAIGQPKKLTGNKGFIEPIGLHSDSNSKRLKTDFPASYYRSKGSGKAIPSAIRNIGKRRTEDTSEFHDNKFEYIGTVGYDYYFGENDHTLFPTLKTPHRGTKILKWYKSHKEAVVGVSEPLLVAEVEKLCQKYDGLTLLEKIALPIQNREYSYRPDIALYWEKHNICIDIEIDEPYDICSHKPLHYIGCSDNLRDTYFTRNGWCVVRYSENQVLHHTAETIKHLEFIINWLARNRLKNYSLFEENRWTYDEAAQMAKSSLREKDLGVEENPSMPTELNQPRDVPDDIFIKPGKDILPETIEQSQESVIESQLNYALASDAEYVRITDVSGIQWILEKNTIQKGIGEGHKYIIGNNPITPSLSSNKYKLNVITQITPIPTLFTKEHWELGKLKPVKEILITAASNGAPIWIKYKNSQGEKSERFLSNVCLFLNGINAKLPFTDLGTIANPEINWRIYIYGLCSIRNEFRQFACDDRLLEVRIVNCNYNFLYSEVYENTLAELVMYPHKYNYNYFERVDYLLKIMPENERNSLISRGNIANYEVIKGNLSKAFDLYTGIPFDTIMLESENETYIWGNVCIDDIEKFIRDYKEKEIHNHYQDIIPLKIVENFMQIKTLLIQAGWKWPD